MKRIIFLACMQAETQYAADVINAAGGNCGHEQSFSIRTLRPSRASGEWAGRTSEASIYALPSLEAGAVEDAYVVHLTESPLHFVQAATASKEFGFLPNGPRPQFMQWLSTVEPKILGHKTEIERASAFWQLLHARFKSVADVTLDMEDFNEEALAAVVAKAGQDLDIKKGMAAPRNYLCGLRDGNVSWKTLEELDGLVAAAVAYGYGKPAPVKSTDELRAERVAVKAILTAEATRRAKEVEAKKAKENAEAAVAEAIKATARAAAKVEAAAAAKEAEAVEAARIAEAAARDAAAAAADATGRNEE